MGSLDEQSTVLLLLHPARVLRHVVLVVMSSSLDLGDVSKQVFTWDCYSTPCGRWFAFRVPSKWTIGNLRV